MQHPPAHAQRYTVEGRIGGRWWVWQRFATHDEAAAEIERLATQKRFDGARLIETVPGWNGAPPVSRELFVLDPNGPRAVDIAQAEALRRAEADAPEEQECEPGLVAQPVADAVARALARVAAEIAAIDEADEPAPSILRPAAEPGPDKAPPQPQAIAAEEPAPPSVLAAATVPTPHLDHAIARASFAWAPPPEADAPKEAAAGAAPAAGAAASEILAEAPPEPAADPAAIDMPAPTPQTAPTLLDDAQPIPGCAAPDRCDPFEDAPVHAEAAPSDAEAEDDGLRAIDEPALGLAAERAWDEFVQRGNRPEPPANDDQTRREPALASFAIMDDDDRVAATPRDGHWHIRLRQVAYTLGAGLASLLLAVASYETTRLLIGLPDLLGDVHQAVGGLLAGPERPVAAAARRGNALEVSQLLRGGFSPNSEDPKGVPALLVAARAGHGDVVRTLLEGGADPNRRFGSNDTPLLAAAREGLIQAVDQMLARGGHVNGRGGNDECDTPLLLAANAGRLEMVNFLLSRGASFDVLPGCRRGPLDAAAAHPRVRETLETAYQRRLAGVPRASPAFAAGDAAPRNLPASPDAPLDLRGYATLMYGFSWRDTLAEVKARSRECRAVGRRYEVCELQVKPLFDDAALVEAWFDRGDGDRFVSIETRSVELVDYTAHRDGATVRQRFDQVRREIERNLPPGSRPIVQRNVPTTVAFFEALKPEIAAGDYAAFWSDDGRRRPASIHLKLSGIDARKGFYRIVVSNPLRQSQQAAAP